MLVVIIKSNCVRARARAHAISAAEIRNSERDGEGSALFVRRFALSRCDSS